MAAALTAARLGVRVELVEATERIGGTMADALLHTLAGLYDSTGALLNAGLVDELLERLSRASGGSTHRRRMGRVYVHMVDPELYRDVVQAWLEEEKNITVSTQSRAVLPELAGRKLARVGLESGGDVRWLAPNAVVDATGGAAVCRGLGPDFMLAPGPTVAGGFIFRLRGVDPQAMKFPRSVGVARAIQEGVESGDLPSSCDRTWLDIGIFEDEAFVKLFVHDPESSRSAEQLREVAEQLSAFLRRLSGFERVTLSQLGRVGIRENGRARGKYVLTEADVRSGARFADAACRCAWPIEHWDAKSGLSLEYLADSYDIPLGALKAAQADNLWFAGKCLSAEPRAQASARCVGTCWAMGQAVGRATVDYLAGESKERDERC